MKGGTDASRNVALNGVMVDGELVAWAEAFPTWNIEPRPVVCDCAACTKES